MQVRRRREAGVAAVGDGLAAADERALADAVGGTREVGVARQLARERVVDLDHVAVAALRADEADPAVARRVEGRADGRRKVDAGVHPRDAQDRVEAHPEARRQARTLEGQDGGLLAKDGVALAGERPDLLVGAALKLQLALQAIERLRGLREQVGSGRREAREARICGAADAELELVLRDRLRVEDGAVDLAVGLGEVLEFIRERRQLRVRRGELAPERVDLLGLGDLRGRGGHGGEHPDTDGTQYEREAKDGAGLQPQPFPTGLDLDESAGVVVVVEEAVVGHADEREAVVALRCGPSPRGGAAPESVCASVHALPKRNNRAETRRGALWRPGQAALGGESATQRGQT